MLNVCTLGAGVAVAALLPAGLALWKIPRVAAAPVAAPGEVLFPALRSGPLPTSVGLSTALPPVLASPALGSHVGVVVTDPVSGAVLWSSNGSSPARPASTAKLATAVAALTVLGPAARFSTSVVAGGTGGSPRPAGGGGPPRWRRDVRLLRTSLSRPRSRPWRPPRPARCGPRAAPRFG